MLKTFEFKLQRKTGSMQSLCVQTLVFAMQNSRFGSEITKQNMETVLEKTLVLSNVVEQLSKHRPVTKCVRPQVF